MGVLACQPSSKFAKAYDQGVHKSKYWESTYEDALDLCAKVSRVAALIFNNKYGEVRLIYSFIMFRVNQLLREIQVSIMLLIMPIN